MRPRVAITVGDPRGIGPEIARKVLQPAPENADCVLIGPAEQVCDVGVECIVVDLSRGERETGKGKREKGEGPGREVGCGALPIEEAGRLVALQVEKAVSLALEGSVDAIVTGPAEKRALHAAGYAYPGHTEWLGVLAGGVDTAMMLTTGDLRVVLATTHIALNRVPRALTVERVVAVGQLTVTALRDWWGMAAPRVAICALNPHAGEDGLFGAEDEAVLAPAARELGAIGPVPADTVFVRALGGEFDAVIAPYHDVGMTAVKVSGFGRGVNVTLGLPFVRTSPDHGTAFDIAGQGIADPSSMQEAVSLAVRLARKSASVGR
ncbi:MAG: 4-hydroxythreonine-4-phosphate dehydrogenase PdxA [Gemmatimonadales bacterium]